MGKCYRGKQPESGVLLAECDGWRLYERPTDGCWRDLKLVVVGKSVKGNFWLAHNGERFAANKDDKVLAEYYPAVRGWVESVLKASHV